MLGGEYGFKQSRFRAVKLLVRSPADHRIGHDRVNISSPAVTYLPRAPNNRFSRYSKLHRPNRQFAIVHGPVWYLRSSDSFVYSKSHHQPRDYQHGTRHYSSRRCILFVQGASVKSSESTVWG